MTNRKIYTNFKNFNTILNGKNDFSFISIDDDKSRLSFLEIYLKVKKTDVIILNIDSKNLFKLCALRYLVPFKKFKLVSVDLLLRKPITIKQRIVATVKSILLKKVDIFALYFKNTKGYEKYFGMQKEKIRYVPFKVNSWEEIFSTYIADPTRGGYVLCAGQTLRDLKTFIEAARISGVPSVLLTPGEKVMNQHGTRLISEGFPPNLKLEIHDDGKEETFLKWIKNAAIVVIPRYSYDISSSGISTYLCAMAAYRCVILSKGPGAEDLLTEGQAILVRPEDTVQLADAMLNAWNDAYLRKRTALKGRRYAEQLQGENRLIRDIYKLVVSELVGTGVAQQPIDNV